MNFKNKLQKYGYYFGKFCYGAGALIVIVCIPFLTNDYGKPINTCPMFIFILGALLHFYGLYRTGNSKDE